MSIMMPPDPGAAPDLPIPPGGGGAGPMDSLNQGPLPAGGGMSGLLDALQGAGGDFGAPPGDMTTGGTSPDEDAQMDPVEHIQQAMKHLMMALGKSSDEEHGAGIVKGMGALQGILQGEQKKNQQLQAIGG